MTARAPALELVDVAKDFGGFRALDGVSLRLAAGSVHAILGENGAGKSTLVKCAMGTHRPTSGRMLVDGREVRPEGPRQAQALGLGMVYQHFTLVENLTVAENLLIARRDLPFVLDWKAAARELDAFLARAPFQVALDARVRALSAGEKQKLEILKQLYLRTRILILDEPTSVLTPAEADDVLGRVRDLARAGALSVLLITHKFREVTAYADDITVLRRGRVSGRGQVAGLTPAVMAGMMVGSAPTAPAARPPAARPGEVRLRVEAVSADDERGAPALREVSLEVRGGEILGVAAVAGNGQEELVEILAGQRRPSSGRVLVHGPLRCLPEEPLRNACVPSMTVAENLAFHDFDRAPYARFGVWQSRAAMDSRARTVIAEYGVRTRSPATPIGQLSGGNVQRAVLARVLAAEVAVLVVANPCMGLDFRAVDEIHGRLRDARERGTAILLVSADLDEIFALADRILVLSAGRVVHEGAAAEAEMGVIGESMAGHRRGAAA